MKNVLRIFIIMIMCLQFGCKALNSNLFYGFVISGRIKHEDFDVIEVYRYDRSGDSRLGVPKVKVNSGDLVAKFSDRKTISELLDGFRKYQVKPEDYNKEPLSSDLILIANGNVNDYLYLIRDKDYPGVYVVVFPSDGWDYIRYKSPGFTDQIIEILAKKKSIRLR